ncbi:Condensation domain-containing protein [Micromonospora nigra]|uniref:Condensation domain-containing protein n=1 Tax=Micromonospora nigra TaxID=145857 RepID=A0A1C6T007_9ACTN|nr:condensation domain-containing protein [Micromonospora nigra]SCL34853.1 Condensation domain-containing protein [Micromonospora nigra]
MRFADAVVPTEWATEKLINAEFRGGRTRTAPLTWAQQVMWRARARNPNNHVFMNLRRTVPVSPRVAAGPDAVARAVGALVGRHSSLRTRVRASADGPVQEAAAAGVLPLLVLPGVDDGAAAARAAATRLGDVAFDHADEWPLRVALVLVDGRVRQIVVVFSHSTVDAHAAEVVLRDLRLILLRGTVPHPAGPQSVDVALDQQGPGRQRSDRAVAYWLRQFARLPSTPLTPVGPGLTPLLRRGVLVSPAAERAARIVAARHRVSSSAVLLAAMTALARRDHPPALCGMFPMAHNRFRVEYAQAVANLGQIGFCVVDLADRPTFADMLPRVWRGALDGYRHAGYEPAALRGRFEAVGHDFDTLFLPYHYFNDVRLSGEVVEKKTDATEKELRAELDKSEFSWTRGLERASWHLLAHVVDEPGALGITLTVDTRFVEPEAVEPFLRDLERLLVEAALRDVPWPWSPSRPAGTATAPPRRVVDEVTPAHFDGGRDRTGPLTWGQQAMWRAVVEFESAHNSFLNLRRTLPLSRRADVDVPRAVRALGTLVARHESLRTRVRVVDGQLTQVAFGRGDLPVAVHHVDGDGDPDGRSASAALAERLGGPRFDHAAHWPLRAGLVVVDGRVRQVVVVFSHSTVDFHATETLLRELRLILLRGAAPGEPGLQSLDVALREQGVEQRRSDRSVASWTERFALLPAGTFTTPGTPADPRYQRGSLVSPALDAALRILAARHRVSTATALLAGAVAVLGDGQDSCGVFTMAHNRFPPGYADAISKLNQIGLCRVDLTGRPDLADLLTRTHRAGLEAYRHAYYDPAAMTRAFAEAGHDYATALAPYCFFNDIRLPDGRGAPAPVPPVAGPLAAPVGSRVTGAGPGSAGVVAVRALADGSRAAATGSTFTWLPPLERFAWRCRIQVVDAPGAVELVVTADTAYLPAARAERLLHAIEAMVVGAAGSGRADPVRVW